MHISRVAQQRGEKPAVDSDRVVECELVAVEAGVVDRNLSADDAL
jgi:hypothetical protein